MLMYIITRTTKILYAEFFGLINMELIPPYVSNKYFSLYNEN